MQDFPPFYTKQITTSSLDKQTELWLNLISSRLKDCKQFTLSTSDVLFENKKISRSLPNSYILELFEKLVKSSKGEWISKTELLVFPYSPEEYADFIMKWIAQTGRNGSVLTLYEIINGDHLEQEFHSGDERVIKKALDVIEKRGKGSLFKSLDGQVGIKFI